MLTPVLCLAGIGGWCWPPRARRKCTSDGDVQFVCGPVSPEDLVLVPDTPWVLAAGMEERVPLCDRQPHPWLDGALSDGHLRIAARRHLW